jgi:ankyrin repeat protein
MSDSSLSSFSSTELETDKADDAPALQAISEGEECDTDMEDVPQILPTFSSGDYSDKSISELLLASPEEDKKDGKEPTTTATMRSESLLPLDESVEGAPPPMDTAIPLGLPLDDEEQEPKESLKATSEDVLLMLKEHTAISLGGTTGNSSGSRNYDEEVISQAFTPEEEEEEIKELDRILAQLDKNEEEKEKQEKENEELDLLLDKLSDDEMEKDNGHEEKKVFPVESSVPIVSTLQDEIPTEQDSPHETRGIEVNDRTHSEDEKHESRSETPTENETKETDVVTTGEGQNDVDLLQLNSLTVATSPARDPFDGNGSEDEQLESSVCVHTEEELISTSTPREDGHSDSASSLGHTGDHSNTDPKASDGDTNHEPATSLDTEDSQSRPSDTPENIDTQKFTIAQEQFDASASDRNEDEAPELIVAADEVRSVENEEKRAFVPTSILKQKKDLLPLFTLEEKTDSLQIKKDSVSWPEVSAILDGLDEHDKHESFKRSRLAVKRRGCTIIHVAVHPDTKAPDSITRELIGAADMDTLTSVDDVISTHALHWAIVEQAPDEIIQLLVLQGGKDIVMTSDVFGSNVLHYALEMKTSEDTLQIVLQEGGADAINAQTQSGVTPVQIALRSKASDQIVKSIVDIGDREALLATNEEGMNALHIAVQEEASGVVIDAIAKKGGDEILHATNQNGFNPLELAGQHKTPLEHFGTKSLRESSSDESIPLFELEENVDNDFIIKSVSWTEVSKCLGAVENGEIAFDKSRLAIKNRGCTILHLAVRTQSPQGIAIRLIKAADIDTILSTEEMLDTNALHWAIAEQSTERDFILKLLIEKGDEDIVTAIDAISRNALSHAIQEGVTNDILELILDKVNEEHLGLRDKSGMNPLQYALLDKRISEEIILSIIQKSRKDDILHIDNFGLNTLQFSIKHRISRNVVTEIIRKCGDEIVFATNRDGLNALGFAIMEKAYSDIIRVIVEEGGEDLVINDVGSGLDAIRFALLHSSSAETIWILINEGGQDVIARVDSDGLNALHRSIALNSSFDIIKVLVEEGGPRVLESTTSSDETILHSSIKNQSSDNVTTYLIDSCERDVIFMANSENGTNALQYALLKEASNEVVESLVKKGGEAILAAIDSNGRNSLHYAVSHKTSIFNVKMMVNAGGKNIITQSDNQGMNSLHLAIICKAPNEAIQYLAKRGGHEAINASDCIGKTPLDYAIDNRAPNEVVIFLVQKGGKKVEPLVDELIAILGGIKMKEEEYCRKNIPATLPIGGSEDMMDSMDSGMRVDPDVESMESGSLSDTQQMTKRVTEYFIQEKAIEDQDKDTQRRIFSDPKVQIAIDQMFNSWNFRIVFMIDLYVQLLATYILSFGAIESIRESDPIPRWCSGSIIAIAVWQSQRTLLRILSSPLDLFVGKFRNWLQVLHIIFVGYSYFILTSGNSLQDSEGLILVIFMAISWLMVLISFGDFIAPIGIFVSLVTEVRVHPKPLLLFKFC